MPGGLRTLAAPSLSEDPLSTRPMTVRLAGAVDQHLQGACTSEPLNATAKWGYWVQTQHLVG